MFREWSTSDIKHLIEQLNDYGGYSPLGDNECMLCRIEDEARDELAKRDDAISTARAINEADSLLRYP